MTVVLSGVKPSGKARRLVDFMAQNGVKSSRAFAILRHENAPPTFKIGATRMIDEGLGTAWFAALADGQFHLDADAVATTRS